MEVMVLSAPSTEALTWKPVANVLTSPTAPDVSELLDTLANRILPGLGLV